MHSTNLDLMKILKLCKLLRGNYKETDNYDDELINKSIELGKKMKEKTLILDMDETLIAAIQEKDLNKDNNQYFDLPDFEFKLDDQNIKVKFRPYLLSSL